METVSPPPVTKRLWRTVAPRATTFAETAPTIGAVLDVLPAGTRRLYLTGGRPWMGTAAGLRGWAYGPLPAGWGHDSSGHYLEGVAPVLNYRSPAGDRVEVHRASAWYGERPGLAAGDAAEGWALLRAIVAEKFAGAELFSTPAGTGAELLLRSIPAGVEYARAPAALVERAHLAHGQGRITGDDEHRTRAAAGPTLPNGLACYDARLAYAALCDELPAGEPVHDERAVASAELTDHDLYGPSRWCVTFSVPRDWAGVGILPVWADGRWSWPAEPGERYSAWCGGAELHLAASWGWRFIVNERVTWPATTRVVGRWARSLGTMRQALLVHAERLPEVERGRYVLAAAGVRAIVLHTIGAFVAAPRRVTRSIPSDQGAPPAGAEMLRVEGGHFVWAEREPASRFTPAHPEWASTVWARQRARLLSAPTADAGTRAGALHVAAADVIAFRTDAIFTHGRQPWADDGKLGRYRLTRWEPGPVPTPASAGALLRWKAAG